MMKPRAAQLLIFSLMLAGADSSALAYSQKEPVDEVSPNIGGIGQLLTATIPYVQYPHGMARLYPVTTPGITDRYLADKIYGFPAGPALLMASTKEPCASRAAYASEFDHDFETATPYYYQARLLTWGISAELTATRTAAFYRFTFPASEHGDLVLSLAREGDLKVVNEKSIEGSELVGGAIAPLAKENGNPREYFFAEFSRPIASWRTWQNGQLSHAPAQSGNDIGFVGDSTTKQGEVIEVRVYLRN